MTLDREKYFFTPRYTRGQVSKVLGVTKDTLRHYEECGLVSPQENKKNRYKYYSIADLEVLNVVLFLRSIDVPIHEIPKFIECKDIDTYGDFLDEQINKAISKINYWNHVKSILSYLKKTLDDYKKVPHNVSMVEKVTFKFRVAKFDYKNYDIEQMAPSRVSSVASSHIMKLKIVEKKWIESNREDTSDLVVDDILDIIESPSLTNFNCREEKSMEDLNSASKSFEELKNVRIIHLPPCTVAACSYVGENPENNAQELLKDFVVRNNLYEIKPDARVFGFNSPCPTPDKPVYGYEYWVTIPDDMKVEKPYVKKYFQGGLYAAHMITLGNFHEWQWLSDWVKGNEKYLGDAVDDDKEMGGLLEEAINYVYFTGNNKKDGDDNQLDLLYPIKIK